MAPFQLNMSTCQVIKKAMRGTCQDMRVARDRPTCPVAGFSSYMVVMGMVMWEPSRHAVPIGRLHGPPSALPGIFPSL